MNRHSKEKDRTARPAKLTGIKPQPTEPLQFKEGWKFEQGPAPKPAAVPSLFAAAPLGVNPLTGRAWE